mgnify:CR=1 FL=1
MLLVAVEFDVEPGDEEAFAGAAGRLAEASSAENGCRFFEVWSDATRPGRFLFLEGWDSSDALVEHRTTSHVAAFKNEAGASIVEASGSYWDAEPTEV